MVELNPDGTGAVVNRAVDRAGFALISSSLKQCLSGPGDAQSADAQSLEKLFLTLA